MARRTGWVVALTVLALADQACRADNLIGYTELKTNLPGGRHANVSTMRACVVRANGSDRRVLVEDLTRDPDTWTQFTGWSPDGTLAVLGRGWQQPDNAAWEEQHKAFRMKEGSWQHDIYLLDLADGKLTNVTAVDRASHFNTGLFFWPNDPTSFGFQAMVKGELRPFRMDRDGHNKKDLSQGPAARTYGYGASPCGKRIAYHKDYQIYLADEDGNNVTQIKTGMPFNYMPQWSPDGQWLLFLAGHTYDNHPYLVRRDGKGLRRLAHRRGHTGLVKMLDVPDFHGGSSDIPVWSPDGAWIYYTARTGPSLELMRISVQGCRPERLTESAAGVLNYQPQVSPDGKKVLFGSTRSGLRQLYTLELATRKVEQITSVPSGSAAMWGHWQPTAPPTLSVSK
jgi:TolB protein